MIRWHRHEHRFVKRIPERLEPGVLYVSIDYASAAHSCCCCEEVMTPFSPTDWKMTFDGETISLWPSVGNWNLRCRSHCVIDRGRVLNSGPWGDAQVAAERRRDKAAKERSYEFSQPPSTSEQAPVSAPAAAESASWWSRLRQRLFNRSVG